MYFIGGLNVVVDIKIYEIICVDDYEIILILKMEVNYEVEFIEKLCIFYKLFNIV